MFCKKYQKVVDIRKDCHTCFSEKKSGFSDMLLCQNYNLDLLEEEDDINVIQRNRL